MLAARIYGAATECLGSAELIQQAFKLTADLFFRSALTSFFSSPGHFAIDCAPGSGKMTFGTIDTSTNLNYYTALKRRAKKHFYGRAAAGLSFSEGYFAHFYRLPAVSTVFDNNKQRWHAMSDVRCILSVTVMQSTLDYTVRSILCPESRVAY